MKVWPPERTRAGLSRNGLGLRALGSMGIVRGPCHAPPQLLQGRRWRGIAKMTLAYSGTSFLRRGSSGGNPRTAFDRRLRGKFTGGY
ncbi:hypothetical protein BDR03DRAFT_955439 [Suillus americanus]|nr:hypothetical protein BDR03DRAFT_955439 [Suillus americanus]